MVSFKQKQSIQLVNRIIFPLAGIVYNLLALLNGEPKLNLIGISCSTGYTGRKGIKMFLSIMIFLGIPIVAILFFATILIKDKDSFFGFVGIAASILIMIFIMISIPVNRIKIMAKVKSYEAARNTIIASRQHAIKNSLETAAIAHKIVNYNEELAELKYFAEMRTFRVFYPYAEIRALKLIE